MAYILSAKRRELILKCLLDGTSVRAAARIADTDKNTVLRLLVDAGRVSAEYQDRMLRNLPCKRIEVDEIWAFVYAKAANLVRAKSPPLQAGDVYTWTAMCRDTKLIFSWRIGDRSADTAYDFMEDLQRRLANRVQLTSDGNMAYIDAVDAAFAGQIDYAMLVKVFGPGRGASARKRYMGTHVIHISGRPDPASISTSFVERSNLTMRMNMRRFTRRTNGFSKKVENHTAAVDLHMLNYNFLRTHETLRVTPAMEAGIVDRFMEVSDLVEMIEADYEERRPKTRGPYRKRQQP